MSGRRQLPLAATVFSAAALLLAGCSSGGGSSAGPSPSRTTPAPSATASTPSATHTTPGSRNPSASGPSAPAAVPDVSITTLHSGGTITLPATVAYTITGLHFTASDGYRLHLTLGGAGSYSLDLPLSGPTGTVTIPRDKMLPGKRDLTFTVVREGSASASLAQHAAHVAKVTIYGPK
ncbi:hypothetical protein [Streptomyces mirabilis]|uniref:hypothetical protein n=1 Tax=Streptomyces mirabilis TaxID=68239 RepID=UPI0036A245BA